MGSPMGLTKEGKDGKIGKNSKNPFFQGKTRKRRRNYKAFGKITKIYDETNININIMSMDEGSLGHPKEGKDSEIGKNGKKFYSSGENQKMGVEMARFLGIL